MDLVRSMSNLVERRFNLSSLDRLMDFASFGAPTWSGNAVNEQRALTNSTVWACVRVLSESVAQLPLHTYRRLENGGKEPATTHYLYSILHDLANPEMTSFEFREVMMGHLLTYGNAYAMIDWDRADRVKGLYPLAPNRIRVSRNDKGALAYEFRRDDGTFQSIDPDYMFHVKGLGFDGLTGYSPISMHRQSIGLALATEEFGGRMFATGAKPSGVLEVTGPSLKDDQKAAMKAAFDVAYSGLSNAHRTIVLEGGVKWVPNYIKPDEAQFLETRKYQRSEIASIYRVPPHLIGDLERSTNNNIEHQGIEFVQLTLMPWLVRWEQQILRSLFPRGGRGQYFAEFNVDGLLRGDLEARSAYYMAMLDRGVIQPNEVRAKENMNPLPGGNVTYRPLNMAYVDEQGRVMVPAADPGNTPQKPQEQLP